MYFLPSTSARMITSSAISQQIGEAALGAAEIADAEPKEQGDHSQAQHETRQIERALAAEEAPAEAVDDPDNRVEAVPEAPALRHDCTRKPDRRDVKAELNDEGDDEAEIAILDVERGQEEGRNE